MQDACRLAGKLEWTHKVRLPRRLVGAGERVEQGREQAEQGSDRGGGEGLEAVHTKS